MNNFSTVQRKFPLLKSSRSAAMAKMNCPLFTWNTVFRAHRNGKVRVDNGRRYYSCCETTSTSVSNSGPKQSNGGTGTNKTVKYVSVFIGSCVLAVLGVRQYWKTKYRSKGLEPMKNLRYGWRHTFYYHGGYNMPSFVVNQIDDIRSFEVRDDDIWIIGFPKSGTTWLQEVVYLVANDADLEKVKSNSQDRIPFFEHIYPGLRVIENNPSPRFMKTHLVFSILPRDYHKKKPKTIYIARNPKDVLVSFYFFLYKFKTKQILPTLSFEQYCQLFIDGKASYGPWWRHVKEGWERRDDDNVLFITYEEMSKDLPSSVKKIAAFLGKKLSDQDVESIATCCSFEQMKNNSFVNLQLEKDIGIAHKDAHFLREGKVGGWKNHLSEEITAELDEIVATKLEPLGIAFEDTPSVDNT